MRKVIPLNYGWKFYPKFTEKALTTGEEKGYQTVDIPHSNIILPFNNFDENLTMSISLYKKDITLQEKDLVGAVILRFYGVSNAAEVYVNNKFAFSHKGAYTYFENDIREFLSKGVNTIAVKVDSTERNDIPPFGNVVDYLGYGGIYREVELILAPKTYIENAQIECLKPLEKNKEYSLYVTLRKGDDKKEKITATALYKGIVCDRKTVESDQKTVKIDGVITNAILWDTQNPILYDFIVEIEGEKSDRLEVKYGFRSAEFTTDGFYLNGKPMKLVGLNRHQSYPYVGYAMPKSMQEEDAKYLKERLNVNLVRTSHYPQSFHFINKCDEIGLLVFTEAPGWQHIGGKEFKETYKQNVIEMVTQYRNHPSIVLWGVRVNESPDCEELYAETNKIAHELDKTRQTGGVRNFAGSNLLEEVYTYNDFIHNGVARALQKPIKITKKRAPYLVTENNGHMYPTKRYDIESRRIEHALRHTRVLNEAYKTKEICGEIGWCMSDYNTHKDFGSGDKVCYHGVSDMFRIEKLAAAPFISQRDGEPYLEPTCSFATGDYNETLMGGFYVFTNCDEIRLYKNGLHIDTQYSKDSKFSSLPHPPIYFPDLIGNTIEKEGKYKKKDAERLKRTLGYVAGHGMYKMPKKYYLSILLICLKYKIKFENIYYEFAKYLTNWGDKECVYKFEGYINGKKVIEREKSQVKEKHYEYETTCLELTHNDTYDVAEVKILAKSEKGNILPYCFDGLSLKSHGAIEVLGDKYISLVGGATGAFVRTIKKGGGKLTITSDLETKEIDFIVK